MMTLKRPKSICPVSARGPTFLISIDAILRFVCEQKYKIYDCQQIYCHISYLVENVYPPITAGIL